MIKEQKYPLEQYVLSITDRGTLHTQVTGDGASENRQRAGRGGQ
uniref:Uncharacterized protein n=1 Tax=Arundo donax TaxID=35708 RepID=A0A0A8ZE37_ARUDO